MVDPDIPPGWSYNPSSWPDRLPVAAIALAGCGIATYLALYQLGVVAHVWEPFFGTDVRVILKQSSIAHLLPIPDAALGALAYLVDAVTDSIGGRDRWRTMPWIVLLLGILAAMLGIAGILLAIFQPVLFDAWCTLCLASAVCSVTMVGLVMDEVLASLQHLKRESIEGRSIWRALWGRGDSVGRTPGGSTRGLCGLK